MCKLKYPEVNYRVSENKKNRTAKHKQRTELDT